MPHNPLEGERPSMTFTMNQEPADDQVSIIVVHRDQPGYLNICLHSIVVTSLNNSYELIVVDNGSTSKDACDFLDDLAAIGDVRVIRNTENLWWSKAANQGAKAADPKSKYFIFMHSDVVITNPAWIDFMIGVSESEKSGLVGLQMHNYGVDNQKMDFIMEWCMLVSRSCYKECGPFMEELPILGSPFIFSLTAQYAGYKPKCIRTPMAHHYQTFSIDPNDLDLLIEQAQHLVPKTLQKLRNRYQVKSTIGLDQSK